MEFARGLIWMALVVNVVTLSFGEYESDSEKCPSFCTCDIWYDLTRASCIGRHLYSVHTGVPANIQALDLSNNSISLLNNYELAETGLTDLKYLNFSHNAISQVGLNAFHNLDHLMVVDLSNNHLYYVLPDTFVENKNLRVLRLSGNNFNNHVPKLNSTSLTELNLAFCQIGHISSDAFNGLRNLVRLDLSNNFMIQLDIRTLTPLTMLKKLLLQRNSWTCNKNLLDLQSHLNSRKIQFTQICEDKSSTRNNVKKFEKMVLVPKRHSKPTMRNVTKIGNGLSEKNVTKSTSKVEKIDEKSSDNFSPYWFLGIGFTLGMAVGTFITYICITTKFASSCCFPSYVHRRSHERTMQSVSLLNNHFRHSDFEISPPPPYFEVISQPNLYPNPNLARNSACQSFAGI